MLAVLVVERGPAGEADAGVGQARHDEVQEDVILAPDQFLDPGPDHRQLLAGAQPVDRAGAHARRHLILERGHADLVELVEQFGEDGQELGPLQQGNAVVLGQVEQAGTEIEARLLTVGEALVPEGLDLLIRRRARVPGFDADPFPFRFDTLAGDGSITRDLGLRLRLGLVLRLGLGHGRDATPNVRGGMSPRILPPTPPIPPGPSVARRARRSPFPRYVFGPKPKRRTELGLLLFGSLLVVALYVIAALGQKSKIPDNIGAFLGVVLGLALLAHMANRWLAPNANAVILPLAALLNGIGYVVIARWAPGQAKGQAAWAALGVVLYVFTLLVVRSSRVLERYRYLLLLAAGIFLVAPLFFSPIYGARLWVHFGSLSFQPIEFSKILLCIFFASYFAENKEMLSIPTAQIGNRLSLDPRPLVPIIVAWGA